MVMSVVLSKQEQASTGIELMALDKTKIYN